jgi:hypothetical protein
VRGQVLSFFLFLVVLCIRDPVLCQEDWQLRKDDEGIRVFTRERRESDVVSYKIQANLKVELSGVLDRLTDVERLPEWVDPCREPRILSHNEKGKYVYHCVYDFPWPLRNRHMVVRSSVIEEDMGRVVRLESRSHDGIVENKRGMVRMTDFWESVTLISRGQTSVQMHVEGFFDPGGNIPPWMTNLYLPQSALKTIKNLKKKLE